MPTPVRGEGKLVGAGGAVGGGVALGAVGRGGLGRGETPLALDVVDVVVDGWVVVVVGFAFGRVVVVVDVDVVVVVGGLIVCTQRKSLPQAERNSPAEATNRAVRERGPAIIASRAPPVSDR
jgi:hypothetical protein